MPEIRHWKWRPAKADKSPRGQSGPPRQGMGHDQRSSCCHTLPARLRRGAVRSRRRADQDRDRACRGMEKAVRRLSRAAGRGHAANRSSPLISMPTTGATSTASRVTTAWPPFSQSRGIELPLGTPEDDPGAHTVHALGNLKDQYFMQHLTQHGVEPYEAVDRARSHAPRAGDQNGGRVLQQQLRGGARGSRYRATVRRASGRDGYHAPRSQGQAGARCFPGGCAAAQGRTSARGRRGGRDRRRRRRGAPADSAASSASIAAGTRRRCARPAPMSW